jgi:hypothetical protein
MRTMQNGFARWLLQEKLSERPAFYAGPSALVLRRGYNQPFGLGWDVAAPLALNGGDRVAPMTGL